MCNVHSHPFPDYGLVWDWHHFTKVLGSCNWQSRSKQTFRAYVRVVSTYSIKMDGLMDRSVTWCRSWYCLDPEFYAYHTTCPEALTDLFTMCDKFHGHTIHGKGSAESAKAQLDWQCFYKSRKGSMFPTNPKRQQMDKCRKDVLGGMVRNVCQALSSWAGMSRHANSGTGNFCLLLWK